LLSRSNLTDALNDPQELQEDHWPDLPAPYKTWLAHDISNTMMQLNLSSTIHWEGNTLWTPGVLPLLLHIVKRYELRVAPDELLIFVATGMDYDLAAQHCQRFGCTEAAQRTLEQLLANPPSPPVRDHLVRFIEKARIWSDEIGERLRTI